MIISLSLAAGSFFLLKSLLFLGSSFFLDANIGFLTLIFPAISLLILKSPFSNLSSFNFLLSSFLLSSILFFLFLSFTSNFCFFFLIYLESCVILMVFYILLFAKDQDKISSTLFMFLTNMCPSILFMYFCSGSVFPVIVDSCVSLSSLSWPFFIFFLGLLASKLPSFLLHFWLTKAHVSASGPGSMILASLLLKIGCVGFYKFSFKFKAFFSNSSMSFLFLYSMMGFLFILFLMIRFCDLKFMVACSSIVHMAPTLPLLLKSDSLSVYSSFLMVVGHGLVSYFIFFLVGCLYENVQSKSSLVVKSVESVSSSFSLWLILFFLFNMGFPPLMTFVSEIIFFYLFLEVSIMNSVTFMISLMLSGLLFFLVSSKFLFGKKSLGFYGSFDMSLNVYSYFYMVFFFFSFFLY